MACYRMPVYINYHICRLSHTAVYLGKCNLFWLNINIFFHKNILFLWTKDKEHNDLSFKLYRFVRIPHSSEVSTMSSFTSYVLSCMCMYKENKTMLDFEFKFAEILFLVRWLINEIGYIFQNSYISTKSSTCI